MWTRILIVFLATVILLGFVTTTDTFAYSRGICSSRGPSVHFHVHGRYRGTHSQNDDLFFLFMLSSTSTTIYCLTLADEEEGWRQKRYRDRRRYSSINFKYIQEQSAQGKGEYLASLAHLHGCDDQSIKPFSKTLQTNYKTLFPGTGKTESNPDLFLKRLHKIIQDTPVLGESCRP